MEFLKEISPRFTQDTYNVFKHNCNNFTNECANFLLGNGIPDDIINLPNEFLNTPIGKMMGPMI
jgi:ankyrin repeat protein